MRFNELSDSNKVIAIKDEFSRLVELVFGDKTQLKRFFLLDPPQHIVPTMEQLKDDLSSDEKAARIERNNALVEKVKVQNAKLDEEFKQRQEAYTKAEKIISTLGRPEICFCDRCVNIDFVNQPIPPELEPLIDAARKEAEGKTY